jgi:hypothetical protein
MMNRVIKGGDFINFVYHMVPKNMMGDTLLSLNELKEKDVELYGRYAEKYSDQPERVKLLERKIPKLNCLWNDVIHFLPLHPFHVYHALKNVGVKVSDDLKFYKIPINNLGDNKNVIYLYRKENYKGPMVEMNYDDVQLLDVEKYEELTVIPADTLIYYEEESKKGNRFGMFPFIPHILSLGAVKISGTEIINWNEKMN